VFVGVGVGMWIEEFRFRAKMTPMPHGVYQTYKTSMSKKASGEKYNA
jgi:hypothetical protein